MLKIDSKKNVWITSDTHYNQKNICRSVSNWKNEDGSVQIDSTRDFKTVSQMNDAIVNNINRVVMQDDILIHEGDWSFGGFESIREFRDRIICREVHIIVGNHDHHILNDFDGIQEIFTSVSEYNLLEYKKKFFVLFHYPITSWMNMRRGYIHLFGHQHSSPNNNFRTGKSMDIGIDTNINFEPYNLNSIISIMDERPSIEHNMIPIRYTKN